MNETVPGSKVLIIEDDRDIRESLQGALELEGFTSIVASNGEEALGLLKRGDLPGLILLDLMMPGSVNGWKFLEIQKKDPTLSAIPTIVVSAARSDKPALADDFIKKPIDLDTLFDVVRKYV